MSELESKRGDRLLRAGLWLLPLVGAAAGPVVIGGDSHTIAKSLVGMFLALCIAFIGAKGYFVPPLSRPFAVLASASLFMSTAVLAFTSSAADAGTLLLGAVMSVVLFLALNR